MKKLGYVVHMAISANIDRMFKRMGGLPAKTALRGAVEDGDLLRMQAILDDIRCGLEHLYSIGIMHVRTY